MNESRRISIEISRSGRADLRVEIPPVNVLKIGDLEELARQIGAAREARVLVLSGLPRAFSAGVEVADHVPEPTKIDEMLAAMRSVLTALVDAPAVTLAAVTGACLGGGAEIAAACDMVLAAEDARIGFPEIRLACFPPGAVALLPVRIGEARAAEWILTGRSFSGREAVEAGFASHCFPLSALKNEMGRLAQDFLSRSPEALHAARDLLRYARRRAVSEVLPRAENAYRKLAGNEELARAVREFERSRQSTIDSQHKKTVTDS